MWSIIAVIAAIFLPVLRSDVTTDTINEEYDYIVVGGGTTGCVVAGRLSEIPNIKVLVLEAGDSDELHPDIAIAAKFPSMLGTDVDWNYTTTSQKRAFGQKTNRVSKYPMGKVLGGSSSINAMHYLRGSRNDFDSWEDHGAEGWNFEAVEPIFQKIENAKSEEMSPKFGRNGPVSLTRNYLTTTPFSDLLSAAAKDLGFDYDDYTNSIEGLSYAVRNEFHARRQNSPTAYIRPFLSARRDRLHVLTRAHVTQVTIDENSMTATGVKYTKGGKEFVVKAVKEIILSAGTFGTPHLLMLSGIGPKEELEKFNIKVLKDLPGVGSNLQDPTVVWVNFVAENITLDDDETTDHQQHSGPQTNTTDLFFSGETAYLGTPTSLSTRERPFPDMAMLIRQASSETQKLSFSLNPLLNHPKSTGTVRLRSADPYQLIEVDPNYYSDDDDLKVHIAGFRQIESFEKSPPFMNAGVRMQKPKACSDTFTEEIPRSDEFYRCLIDQATAVLNHACCTAKIGRPDDKLAVLDPQLRVYGINGLRVADASVMPHVASSTSQGPCFMIGEKAAMMIKAGSAATKISVLLLMFTQAVILLYT